MEVDSEPDLSEPVRPFELLSLTESNDTSDSNSATTADLSSTSGSIAFFETTTIIPDFGVISQSIELISTGSSLDEPISRGNPVQQHGDPCVTVTPLPATPSNFPKLPEISVTAPNSEFFTVDAKNITAPLDPFGEVFRPVCGAVNSETSTGVEDPRPSSSALHSHGIAEIPPFIHRSVSSPIFGSTSSSLSLESENDSNSAMSSKSDKKAKRRKPLLVNIKFPEAEPPAQRPRFQWYQGKGLIRIHLLIKNVLPKNLTCTCTGRDLVFRCKADGSPFPPTHEEATPPAPLVEYHLPLRLPHRVYPEPEFSRISPTRVEVHYKKVKPLLEWSCLWKSVTVGGAGGVAARKDPDVSSSDSEDEAMDVESADENDETRPAKRFMNDGKRGNGPFSETDVNAGSSGAVFTLGSNLAEDNAVVDGASGSSSDGGALSDG